MFSIDELTKTIKLNFPDSVSNAEKKELLNQIGDYVVVTMLDLIADGISPVTGKSFSKLTKPYSNKEKGGDRTPNMDLNGDMLNALTYEIVDGIVNVGWFDSDQSAKAYGHTTGFKGHPWLDGEVTPRKLIPNTKEKFTPEIMAGIREIIEDFFDE